MIRDMDIKEIDWLGIKEALPIGDSEEDESRRKQLWPYFDSSGNGIASLAEVDGGLLRIGGPLKVVFYAKKATLLAFKKSKNTIKTSRNKGEDYLEIEELKTFFTNLRQYFEYFYMFKKIDVNNDNRIDVFEFKNAEKLINSWGCIMENSEKEFKDMDPNGGEYILFE